MRQRFCRIPTWSPQFFWKVPVDKPYAGKIMFTRMDELMTQFQGCAGQIVSWRGLVNLRHRGLGGRLPTATTDAVAWCVKGSLRQASCPEDFPTFPGSSADYPYYSTAPWLACTKAAGNIGSLSDHYATAVLLGEYELPADAWYRFEWWGNSSSQNWPDGTNGLVEVHMNAGDPPQVTKADPYSWLHVTVSGPNSPN